MVFSVKRFIIDVFTCVFNCAQPGKYVWQTYQEVYDIVIKLGNALRNCGVEEVKIHLNPSFIHLQSSHFLFIRRNVVIPLLNLVFVHVWEFSKQNVVSMVLILLSGS